MQGKYTKRESVNRFEWKGLSKLLNVSIKVVKISLRIRVEVNV